MKFKHGDKVRIIQRKPENRTGTQNYNNPNGDVGKVCYVITGVTRFELREREDGTGNYYGLYDNSNKNCFQDDDLELVSDEFVLPEKWCIKPTETSAEVIFAYFSSINHLYEGYSTSWIISPSCYFVFPQKSIGCWGYSGKPDGYTEITYDQFKRYVLKDTVETVEKPKFEVGKWYKFIWKWDGSKWYYGQFDAYIKNSLTWSIWFRTDGSNLQKNAAFINTELGEYSELTDLSEIQKYLPDGHPDKIKPMEKNEFKKGDYIVITECNSGTTNGKLNHCYKLIDNDYRFKKMSRIPLDEPHRKKARYATPEEIAEYDRLGEPYDITTLNVQQIPVDESLVGRYLKALRNNPRGVQVTTGNYVLITERGCVKVENNKSTWACSVIQKGEFELMPEGFVPPTEPKAAELPETVSEKWEPKVGDWVVILPCPSNVNWVLEMNEFVGKCVQLKDKDYYFRIDEDNKRWSWEYTERVKHFRKAEPHEIPKTKPMNEYTAEEALAELKRRGFKKGVKYTRMCSDGTYCEGDELIAKKDPENREHYIDCGGGFLWSKDNPSHLHRGPISEPITNPCAEIVIPKLEEGISRYDWFAPPTFQAGTSYQAIHNGTPNYLDPASLLPKTKLPI